MALEICQPIKMFISCTEVHTPSTEPKALLGLLGLFVNEKGLQRDLTPDLYSFLIEVSG